MSGMLKHRRGQRECSQPVESCAIITTRANEIVASVHDRMPVIVPAAAHALWLNPAAEDPGRLLTVLKPYSTEEMICAETDLSGPALFIKSSSTLLSE